MKILGISRPTCNLSLGPTVKCLRDGQDCKIDIWVPSVVVHTPLEAESASVLFIF